jgi:cobalt-zinc-cadmium efflux system protein
MVDTVGIAGVHDLHIWTVTSGLVAMSAHVEIDGERGWQDVLGDSTRLLRERFGIAHVTLQPEPAGNGGRPFDGCSLDTPEGQEACCMAVGIGSLPERHYGHNH